MRLLTVLGNRCASPLGCVLPVDLSHGLFIVAYRLCLDLEDVYCKIVLQQPYMPSISETVFVPYFIPCAYAHMRTIIPS